MSAGVEGKIFGALANALDAYVSSNPIAVAYPGLPFVPTAGVPFLRPWHLPAPTLATDWARSNDYSGIFSIDVFWPAGQGIKPAMAAASRLIDFFVGGQPFRSGSISLTSEKLIEDGTNTIHFVGAIVAPIVVTGTQMFFSMPAKAAERKSVILESFDGANPVKCEFDLVNVVAGTPVGCTPAIFAIGNGEFLVSIAWTMLFDASVQFVIFVNSSFGANPVYVGTPGAGVFIGRARWTEDAALTDFDMAGGTTNGSSVIGSIADSSQEIAVTIIEPPYLSPAQQEPGWLQIPVNIRYRAFARASGLIEMAIAATEGADIAAFSVNAA